MNLIIESNFLCNTLWHQAKDLKNFDFQTFLKQRKKRLSATMILFSDCADWKFPPLNDDTLLPIQQIGYLIEMISIIGHDLCKWKVGAEHNVFQYWLMTKEMKSDFDLKETVSDFMKEIRIILQKKKEGTIFFKDKRLLLQKQYVDLIETVSVLLKEYYKFDEVDILKNDLIGEPPKL